MHIGCWGWCWRSTTISERHQIVSCEPPDVYHRSPDSGELQCKPRELKRQFDHTQVLEVVLAMGNYLNGQGAKGGAFGYKLESRPFP